MISYHKELHFKFAHTKRLMYLTRFNESDRFGSNLDITWKGYDFNIINELDEED